MNEKRFFANTSDLLVMYYAVMNDVKFMTSKDDILPPSKARKCYDAKNVQ